LDLISFSIKELEGKQLQECEIGRNQGSGFPQNADDLFDRESFFYSMVCPGSRKTVSFITV